MFFDLGIFTKSLQAGNNKKTDAQGEQIAAIMKYIIEVAEKTGKKARRLWLDNVADKILINDLEKKYNHTSQPFNVEAVIGEYDAPEKQSQGVVKYNYLENGNTIIYGNDGSEKEELLSVLLYSTAKNHKVEEINCYIIDYGSESLRKYEKLPHVGGIVYQSEEEKYTNLLKMLKEEMKQRKKLFADYGGEYKNYNANNENKVPLKVVILNNYDSINEAITNIVDDLSDLVRDSDRYGIIFIITCNATNSISSKITQNFRNAYAYKLKEVSDYQTVFNAKTKNGPREIFGRGLFCDDSIHEFQTATITLDNENLNSIVTEFVKEQKNINPVPAKKIPTLPEVVTFDTVKEKLTGLNAIPIGISSKDLEIITMDLTANIGTGICANKLNNMKDFTLSFIEELSYIQNSNIFIFDPLKILVLDDTKYPYHYQSQFDENIQKLIDFVKDLKEKNAEQTGVIMIYGIKKFISKLENESILEKLMNAVKEYEKMYVILFDEPSKLKSYSYETWFTGNFNLNDGLWIGKGMSDQAAFHITTITKDMTKEYKNNMGYFISESSAKLCKLIDFVNNGDDMNE